MKNTLSIPSILVDGTRFKYVSCRYCIISSSDEVWFELLLCYLCGCVGADPSCVVSKIFYNPFLLSLGPWMIILTFCLIFTSFYLNSAVYLESYRFPIETSELFLILGMLWPSHASSGKAGKSSKKACLFHLCLST